VSDSSGLKFYNFSIIVAKAAISGESSISFPFTEKIGCPPSVKINS